MQIAYRGSPCPSRCSVYAPVIITPGCRNNNPRSGPRVLRKPSHPPWSWTCQFQREREWTTRHATCHPFPSRLSLAESHFPHCSACLPRSSASLLISIDTKNDIFYGKKYDDNVIMGGHWHSGRSEVGFGTGRGGETKDALDFLSRVGSVGRGETGRASTGPTKRPKERRWCVMQGKKKGREVGTLIFR